MQKFEFLRQPLLGELAMSPERGGERREEEEKKMPFIVATLVCSAGARNTLGPIYFL